MKRRKYRKLAKKRQKMKEAKNKSLGAHLGFCYKSPKQIGNRNKSKNQPAMAYSVEDIYRLVGRDDKVAVLTFHQDSETYKKFGDNLTVVFVYDVKERERLEKHFNEKSEVKTFGHVNAKPLVINLEEEQTNALKEKGIFSKDIQFIFGSPWTSENPFYKEEKRELNIIEIPMKAEPKGGDYNWIYGFYKKKLHQDHITLIPDSMDLYLAMKMFFEPDKLSEEEQLLIGKNGNIKESIERKFLEIKLNKEVNTKKEEERFYELSKEHMLSNLEILKIELERAGTDLSNLYNTNVGLFHHLMEGTYLYIPEQLNGFKGRPIYFDWKGYIHVFTHHVKEFHVGERYANSSKLLWHPKDVIPVIKNVISQVDGEIQEFWSKNPSTRFSKYGVQSFYFEGDYYTFHIEPNGTVSTFHNIRKRI